MYALFEKLQLQIIISNFILNLIFFFPNVFLFSYYSYIYLRILFDSDNVIFPFVL